METQILKVLTQQMHAMGERLHCLTVSTGLRADHGMVVMVWLFVQIVRYDQTISFNTFPRLECYRCFYYCIPN